MEVTLSYRQLAAVVIAIGVLAGGVGVITLAGTNQESSAAQQSQINENFPSSTPITTQELLEITSAIRNLQSDLNAIKTATAKANSNDIAHVEERIAALEERLKELSEPKEELEVEHDYANELDEVYALLIRLEEKMDKLELEIATLNEKVNEV